MPSEKEKGSKPAASDSSGNVCRGSVGIQDEVLGGQRPAWSEDRIGQEGTVRGRPTHVPTAQLPEAQPSSSKGLPKGSLRGGGFLVHLLPE